MAVIIFCMCTNGVMQMSNSRATSAAVGFILSSKIKLKKKSYFCFCLELDKQQ